MKKYLAIASNAHDEYIEVFDTKEEANQYAERYYNHLTRIEQQKVDVYVIDITEMDLNDTAFDDDLNVVNWKDYLTGGYEEGLYYSNINRDMVLENLKALIGKEFDESVVEAFGSFDDDTEVIVSEAKGYTNNFEGYGVCTAWNAYINAEGSEVYIIWVNEDNIIAEVR